MSVIDDAQSPDPIVRARVAADITAPPELLYYLSNDRDWVVRAAAADNESTPLQAIDIILQDDDHLVRAALARKIGRVLPRLDGAARQSLMMALTLLCQDKATDVRAAVAVTLQDSAFLPPKLARLLAEDSERAVAGPILRFCLSLSDDDLVELVKTAKHDWVALDVAQRMYLSNRLALAVWETGNSEAAALMLANTKADPSDKVIAEATESASIEIVLQAPLVVHPKLKPSQMERLATFVETSLLGTLARRAATDRGTLSDVTAIVSRRLDWAQWRREEPKGNIRARSLFAKNQLDDDAVSDAISYGEKDFVITALSLLSETPELLVAKVLEHQSPKGITALCWRAGVSMRVCRQIQIRIARVAPAKAINAREGFGYPMTKEDIIWQLEFYGIVAEPEPVEDEG